MTDTTIMSYHIMFSRLFRFFMISITYQWWPKHTHWVSGLMHDILEKIGMQVYFIV